MLCYVMLCYVMLCYVMLCYDDSIRLHYYVCYNTLNIANVIYCIVGNEILFSIPFLKTDNLITKT